MTKQKETVTLSVVGENAFIIKHGDKVKSWVFTEEELRELQTILNNTYK